MNCRWIQRFTRSLRAAWVWTSPCWSDSTTTTHRWRTRGWQSCALWGSVRTIDHTTRSLIWRQNCSTLDVWWLLRHNRDISASIHWASSQPAATTNSMSTVLASTTMQRWPVLISCEICVHPRLASALFWLKTPNLAWWWVLDVNALLWA